MISNKTLSLGGHVVKASALVYVGPVKKCFPSGYFITVGLSGGFSFAIEGTKEVIIGHQLYLTRHIVMSTGEGDPYG